MAGSGVAGGSSSLIGVEREERAVGERGVVVDEGEEEVGAVGAEEDGEDECEGDAEVMLGLF